MLSDSGRASLNNQGEALTGSWKRYGSIPYLPYRIHPGFFCNAFPRSWQWQAAGFEACCAVPMLPSAIPPWSAWYRRARSIIAWLT